VGKRLAKITREAYNLNAEMNTMMSERFNVAGALLVKIFGRPQYESDAFRARTGRVRDIGVTTAMYGRVFFTGLMLTAALATALVYGVGGVLVVNGALTVGTLVALAQYLTRLYGPLTSLSNVQVDIMTALVSFDRVFEVLDLPPMIDDKPDAVTVERGAAQVAFDHVNFRYPRPEEVSLASLESVAVLERTGGQQVLFDVSFVAEPGQLVALVGPSGAGKSTVFQLLLRFFASQQGRIRFDGVDIADLDPVALRRHIAVVAQDPVIFSGSIASNIGYGRDNADFAQIRRAADAANASEFIDRLPNGFDTLVGERGVTLSGGQRQRLAIARAILRDAPLLLLDEATSALDAENELLVQQGLANLMVGRTTIVIAHRLATIQKLARIVVMDQGRIVAEGSHGELVGRGGLYARLAQLQFSQGALADA
jgi:ATP-binding cassette subfamily B protein